VKKKLILFKILRDSVTNCNEMRPELNAGYKEKYMLVFNTTFLV